MENFEKWLAQNREKFVEPIPSMFDDSINCYHANIVRPAFQLSYQAMMLYFRDMILNGEMPRDYHRGKWIGLLGELRKDSKWDETTFDATQQKNDPINKITAILNIPDQLRSQFSYWRSLRNDCAHYKENRIIKAHVQSLWSFIEQYLLTFTIEGGSITMIRKFEDFYNPAKTSPNADIDPLLIEIPTRVKVSEFDFFFKEVGEAINKYGYHNFLNLIQKIFKCGKKEIRDPLISFLEKDRDQAFEIIVEYPEFVNELYINKNEIRELWFNKLEFVGNKTKIFANLLSAGNILPGDAEEACRRMLKFSYEYHDSLELTSPENEALKSHQYYKIFVEEYLSSNFTKKNYEEICYKTDFYMDRLLKMEIDDSLVTAIIDVFDNTYPYTLKNRINAEFLLGDRLKAINNILEKKNLTLPECLINGLA